MIGGMGGTGNIGASEGFLASCCNYDQLIPTETRGVVRIRREKNSTFGPAHPTAGRQRGAPRRPKGGATVEEANNSEPGKKKKNQTHQKNKQESIKGDQRSKIFTKNR